MEHVFPEPDSRAGRRKWIWRCVCLFATVVSLYLVIGRGMEAFSGGVGAGLALLLLSFFQSRRFQRPDLRIDTGSRAVQFGYRFYPLASIREIRVTRFQDGTAALRLRADGMRELRIPAREQVDTAVAILLELNPAIRVRYQDSVAAGGLQRRRFFRRRPPRGVADSR